MKKLTISIALLFCIFFETFAQLQAGFKFTVNNPCTTPELVSFTNTSIGAVSYFWDFDFLSNTSTAVDPTHNYLWAGTFAVKLVAYDGGGDSSVVVIPVKVGGDFLMLTPNVTPLNICPGEKVHFRDDGIGSTSYLWDFGDGSTSTLRTTTHVFNTPGVYTIKLTGKNDCDSLIDSLWTVTVSNSINPTSFFNFVPDSICPGKPLDFTNFGDNELNTFLWEFGDGDTSTEVHPSHAYSTVGLKTIKLITSNLCNSDTFSKTVVVTNTVSPSTTFSPSTATLCPGEEELFFVNVKDGAVKFTWDFDDGNFSNQDSVTHSFATVGSYNVVFTATNLCNNTLVDNIVVNVTNASKPTATIYYNFANSNKCAGLPVEFVDTSSGSIVSRFWDFGDGDTSILKNPTHIFASAGIYGVTLIVTNLCGNSDTTVSNFTVAPSQPPGNSFGTLPGNRTICDGSSMRFMYVDNDVSDIYWQLGDGDTAILTDFSHQYNGVNSYDVVCKVTNYCGITDYSAQTINVIGGYNNAALFTFTPSVVCSGNQIHFNVESWLIDESMNYSWDFGDGNTATGYEAHHSFSTNGEYVVTLIANNNCGADTSSLTVTVKSGAIADFVNTTPCAGSITSFTDNSTGSPTSWFWDFGDGDTAISQNPDHVFATAGTYEVRLTIHKNCCFHSVSKEITVIAATSISANFGYDNTNGLQVSFLDSSINAVSWFWDFGDGNTATTQNPSNTYSATGTYSVKLVAANACGIQDSIEKSVVVTVGIRQYKPDTYNVIIYPNPVDEEFILKFETQTSDKISMSLHDILGEQLYSNSKFVENGSHEIVISTKYVQKGIYFLKIYFNRSGKGLIRKMIKVD